MRCAIAQHPITTIYSWVKTHLRCVTNLIMIRKCPSAGGFILLSKLNRLLSRILICAGLKRSINKAEVKALT